MNFFLTKRQDFNLNTLFIITYKRKMLCSVDDMASIILKAIEIVDFELMSTRISGKNTY